MGDGGHAALRSSSFGGLVHGVVAGEGEEDLVEAGLAQRQLGHGHLGVGQPLEHRRRQPRVTDLGRHRLLGDLGGGPGQVGDDPGHQRHVGRADRADPQDLPADLGLELVGGADGDDPAAVDHHHVVGQLVRLLHVLGGQQHRDPVGWSGPDDLPQVAPGPRVEAGGRLVQVQHPGPADQAGGQVEPAPHAPRVGLDGPAAGVGQAELRQQLGRPAPGGGARLAEQAAEQQEVLDAGEALVDGRVLAGQGDQAGGPAGPGRRRRSRRPGPGPRPARAGWPGCGPRWSCRPRWGRARPGRCRSVRPGPPRPGRWCRRSA